jgi:adenylylsulfate kinase
MQSNSGFTIWFTGLSGAGKSTLAARLASVLSAQGRRVEILDGDEVRQHLSAGLGFSKADRDVNVRRIGFVARLLSRNGVVAIAATISPYRAVREELRLAHEAPFLEVFAECPLDELIRRDTKGLYAKAVRGEVVQFTGVSDPYEPPCRPDLVIHTAHESIDESLARLLGLLGERHLLPQTTTSRSVSVRRTATTQSTTIRASTDRDR